jgi:hypothetical protein
MPKKARTDKRKAYQASAWAAAQATHATRRAEQDARARKNAQQRAEGKPTPWQAVKVLRLERRAAVRAAQPSGKQS